MVPQPSDFPGPIDRDTPILRPVRRAVMRQNWSSLLFLHWEVPADQLRPPPPPRPGTRSLPRSRLRRPRSVHDVRRPTDRCPTGSVPVTIPRDQCPYVRARRRVRSRRLVLQPDAANPLAVATARAWYHLPYHHARMRLIHESPDSGTTSPEGFPILRNGSGPVLGRLRARSNASRRGNLAGRLGHAGSLSHRTLPAIHAHRGRLYRGQVHHAPYQVQAAEVTVLEESLLAAAGLNRPDSPPIAHYSKGVRVEVFPLTPLLGSACVTSPHRASIPHHGPTLSNPKASTTMTKRFLNPSQFHLVLSATQPL